MAETGHAISIPGEQGKDMLKIILPIMKVVEIPFVLVQKTFGVKRVAWLFLLPNLILFCLFSFILIYLNFAYSFTSGGNVLLAD